MERQLSLMSPSVELSLGRTELETLAQGLRRLLDEAAASRDECEAMGMREMAQAAEQRHRDLLQLEERLLAALATLDWGIPPAEAPAPPTTAGAHGPSGTTSDHHVPRTQGGDKDRATCEAVSGASGARSVARRACPSCFPRGTVRRLVRDRFVHLLVHLLVAGIALAGAACHENVYSIRVDGTADFTVRDTIGQQGGTLRVTDPANPAFGTEVTVPPGAVSRDTEMTISPADVAAATPLGARALGPQIAIAFATVSAPVTLRLPFRIDAVPGESLVVLRLPDSEKPPRAVKERPFGETWRALEVSSLDGRTVEVEVGGFGLFMVAAVRGATPGADGGPADGGVDAGPDEPPPPGDVVPPTFAGLDDAQLVSTSPPVARLTWRPAEDDRSPAEAIRYRIYLPSYGTIGASHGETPPGATEVELPLTPGVRYYFVVRAVDAAGNEDQNLVVRSLRVPGGGDLPDGGGPPDGDVPDGGGRDGSPDLPPDMTGEPLPPEVICPAPRFTTQGATEQLVVTVNARPGDPIRLQSWQVLLRPAGSVAVPNPDNAATTSMTLDLAGNYELHFTALAKSGLSASCTTQLVAVATTGLRLYISWDTDMTDIDAHLLYPTAAQWEDPLFDCHYANCASTSKPLDWGPGGDPGNPVLDLDDTNGFGPENINVPEPEIGVAYRLGAYHYFDGREPPGPTVVTARVFCAGALVSELSHALVQGEFWRVADITLSAPDTCSVTVLDEIVPPDVRPIPR